MPIRRIFRLSDISGNIFGAHKKRNGAFWWLFFSIIAYKGRENPARVFRQKVAINLYREVAYQGRCFDRARGCRLSYHEACILYPLYNNAGGWHNSWLPALSPNCNSHTNHNRGYRCIRLPYTTQTILNDVRLSCDVETDYYPLLLLSLSLRITQTLSCLMVNNSR